MKQSNSEIDKTFQDFLHITYLIKQGNIEQARKLLIPYTKKELTLEDEWLDIAFTIKQLSIDVLTGNLNGLDNTFKLVGDYFDRQEELDKIQFSNLVDYYNYHGMYSLFKGNPDDANLFFKKALLLDENGDYPLRYAKSLSNYAIFHFQAGDLIKGLALLFDAKELQQQGDDQHGLVKTLANIVEVMILQGNYKLAYDYVTQANSIFENVGSNEGLSTNIANKAYLASSFLNKEVVIDLFEKSLQIKRDNKNDMHPLNYGRTLLEYIEFRLQIGLDCEELIHELKILSTEVDVVLVEKQYEVATAIQLYIKGTSMMEKLEAVQILKELERDISNQYRRFHDFVLDYVVDGILFRTRALGLKQTMSEILEYVEKYRLWGKDENSIRSEIKGHILDTQVKVYQGNYDKAQQLLTDIIFKSKNKGMPNIYYVANSLMEKLLRLRKLNMNDTEIHFLPSFVDIFYPHNIDEKQEYTIEEIVLVTSLFDQIKLYSGTQDFDYIELLSKIDTPRKFYLHYFDNVRVMILDKGEFKLCILYQGSFHFLIHKLEILCEIIKLKITLSNDRLEDSISILKNDLIKSELSSFIEGQIISKDNDESLIKFPTPRELAKYEILLHPCRLSIITYLSSNFTAERAELRKYVGEAKSTFARNLKKLQIKELIRIETLLVEKGKRQYVSITPKGITLYRDFNSVIEIF